MSTVYTAICPISIADSFDRSAIIVTHFVPAKINLNHTGQLEMSLVATNDTSNTWYLNLTRETPSERCALNTWSDKLAGSNTAAYKTHANSLASVRLIHDWAVLLLDTIWACYLITWTSKQCSLQYWSDAWGDPEMTKCQYAIFGFKKRNAMSKTCSGTLTQQW